MRYFKLTTLSFMLVAFSLAFSPQPAQAFTLFGIHFFEKAKPTVTPTPKPTPTPTPITTVSPTPVMANMTDQSNLPSTGPEQNVAGLLLAIIVGFIARKYWQVSHQI